jgi:hypothetical protein
MNTDRSLGCVGFSSILMDGSPEVQLIASRVAASRLRLIAAAFPALTRRSHCIPPLCGYSISNSTDLSKIENWVAGCDTSRCDVPTLPPAKGDKVGARCIQGRY